MAETPIDFQSPTPIGDGYVWTPKDLESMESGYGGVETPNGGVYYESPGSQFFDDGTLRDEDAPGEEDDTPMNGGWTAE